MDPWPTWLDPQTDNSQLVAACGWAGRLFALVEGPEGVSVHFHDGEVRTPQTLVDAVGSLSPGEQRVLALTETSARSVLALRDAAQLARSGDPRTASAAASALQDLGLEPSSHQMRPTPPERAHFVAQALDRAANHLLHGDAVAAGPEVIEALAVAEAPSDGHPCDAFFWSDAPEAVAEAARIAGTFEPATGVVLPLPGSAWHVLSLPEPFVHPSGAMVEAVPIPPGNAVTPESRFGAALKLVANRVRRLRQLPERGAPELILENERRMIGVSLERLIDAARQPAPAPRRRAPMVRSEVEILRLQVPPTDGITALFRVPFRTDGPRFAVQRPDGLSVVSAAGVEHRLPPCAWRPMFGSSRYVAYIGRLVSGTEAPEVAVLDVTTGTWCSEWPDEVGIGNLHGCWLPEHDDSDGWWVVDPRSGLSRPVPGRIVAHETENGGQLLLRTADGLVLAQPSVEGVELTPLKVDGWPAFVVDVDGGIRPWSGEPTDGLSEPHATLSRAHFGAPQATWRGTLYANGGLVAVFRGAVRAMALEGGSGTRDGDVAVLTDDALLSYAFVAADEDFAASIEPALRLPLD